jgi:RimJ/RimL family protein N-acetyltransferase
MAAIRGREQAAFDPRPVVLEGPRLRLEPLRMEHTEELFRAVRDPDIWTWLSFSPPQSSDEIAGYVRRALDHQIIGEHLPWLTRRRADGAAIGTTRFAHIDRVNRSVEIGWSMLGRDARGTGLNAEAKYLQLRHAFEDLKAIRVWLNTDERNRRSQRAMEKIGAVLEARHRQDRVMPDGHIRTSVFYSIIDSDWPEVRRRLEEGLPRP